MQYFVAVAEELHFGRAAERLHIAQPSLSQQIRRLERGLGVTLFDRTSRRVELTPAGETLLREGRRLLEQARRAVRLTQAAAAEHLVVGFAGSAAGTLLAEVLRSFNAQQPGVEVSVRELMLDQIGVVRSGEVDLALTRLLPGQADVEVEVLSREARVAALPATHRLATRSSIAFNDLRQERFITNPAGPDAGPPARWLQEQRRHGLPGNVAAEAASVQELLTLVATGRGVCLVPTSVARTYQREDVRYVSVSDAEEAVVSIAWTRATLRPVVRAFIEAARQVVSAVDAG